MRQEDNTLPKAGAIGIGALTGLIFGLRGGLFKRTIYATTGALGMAAVCYPKEASVYAEQGLVEGKKYLTIAYNFVYGGKWQFHKCLACVRPFANRIRFSVKKDDPPLELPSLPKLPTSASEVWDSIKSSASSLISGEPSKAENVSNSEKVSSSPTEMPFGAQNLYFPETLTESPEKKLSGKTPLLINVIL